MVDVLQDHLLCFGVFNLVFLDNVVFVNRLYGKQLFGVVLIHKQHCPKGTFSQDYSGNEVIYLDLFLLVAARIKSSGSFPHHFLLLLFSIDIFLEGDIVVHNELSLDILDPLLLLLVFCGGVMDEVEIISVKNWQFGATTLPTGLENAADNLIPAF